MCGVCGIVNFDKSIDNNEQIKAFASSLAHRGPDGTETYISKHVCLGHTRLSIIDLSSNGKQPFCNENKTIWCICNGEIYNFLELKKILKQENHKFYSENDCEIIVHAYEKWGDDCVKYFKGMFAICIWDSVKNRILLIRDRLGVKPLFYMQKNSNFYFASEIQSFMNFIKPSANDIDLISLDYYLSKGNLPPNLSIFKNINKLLPGHILIYEKDSLNLKKYWSVEECNSNSNSDILEELNFRLNEATKIRLRSDVPLGVFLSGGIDSGLITAMTSLNYEQQVNTFSVKFDNSSVIDDETELAKKVALKYQTNHHELFVSSKDSSVLPLLLWHVGEPFADSSLLPTYLISKSAKDYIKVALTGDGGDESFGGYKNIHSQYISDNVLKIVNKKLIDIIYSGINNKLMLKNNFLFRLRRWSDSYIYRNQDYNLVNYWNINNKSDLYSKDYYFQLEERSFKNIIIDYENYLNFSSKSQTEWLLKHDLYFRLPRYLTKVDITSSLAPIEIRSPFLDHELIQFAFNIKIEEKLKINKTKYLLRELSKKYLPNIIINAPKRGFSSPLKEWFKSDMKHIVEKYLFDSNVCASGLLNNGYIIKIINEHFNGMIDHSQRIYTLLNLEIWWRLFISKTMSSSDEL